VYYALEPRVSPPNHILNLSPMVSCEALGISTEEFMECRRTQFTPPQSLALKKLLTFVHFIWKPPLRWDPDSEFAKVWLQQVLYQSTGIDVTPLNLMEVTKELAIVITSKGNKKRQLSLWESSKYPPEKIRSLIENPLTFPLEEFQDPPPIKTIEGLYVVSFEDLKKGNLEVTLTPLKPFGKIKRYQLPFKNFVSIQLVDEEFITDPLWPWVPSTEIPNLQTPAFYRHLDATEAKNKLKELILNQETEEL